MAEPLCILLIDDEELVRDELGELLEEEGYQVVTGADGDEGLELFHSLNPDMVITDVNMPRRDGLSVAISIREEAPHVPVSIITGHGCESMAIQALRAGVTDFIKKPVHLEDLITALNRMQAVRQLIPQREPTPMPAAVEVVRLSSLYRLDNSPEVIPPFVEMLLHRGAADTRSKPATELSLALRELILNAIEHGNLGITFEEKTRALEHNTLEELLRQRAQRPKNSRRRVTVESRTEDRRISVRIIDQGQGFDWKGLPDPTDPAHLLSTHGRGILLARMMVDRLEYNEQGNQVTVTKSLVASSGS